MSRNVLTKALLAAVLLGTALLNPPRSGDWFVPGLLLFGLFNAIVSPPGTQGVRLAAIAATVAALWWPAGLRVFVALMAWLVWPPAFCVTWALAREASLRAPAERPENEATAFQARITVAALIVSVSCGVAAYRVIVAGGLAQTAALFVGVPAIVAIVVVFAVSPRTATGVACKAVTIGLLVSLGVLGEGMLCVAMSAPLFYVIGIAIGASMEMAHRRRNKATTLFSCAFLVAIVPMSLEGVAPLTTFNRDESVTETRIVRAASQDVERALFAPARFDRTLPLYLRAGFPRGVTTTIEHGADGMRWLIQIRGGEMRLNGMEPRSGELVLALEDRRPGYVRWRAVSDSSHMTHFLTWQESTVEWTPIGPDTTKVAWTLRYRRDLDPAWYFGPWERYAARLAAGYLIDAVATP